jgi:hypothetical protein
MAVRGDLVDAQLDRDVAIRRAAEVELETLGLPGGPARSCTSAERPGICLTGEGFRARP